MKPTGPCIAKGEYEVRDVDLATAYELVAAEHYAGTGANTATYLHGLFHRSDFMACLGVAWWIPPTKSAALATYPQNWKAVIALSRLVVVPEVPQNAASFLIGQSIRRIRQDGRFKCLVTYADTWRGHTGKIYRATNWQYVGKTTPEATWVDGRGRLVARKAGPRTRTKAEMERLGYQMVGRFSKHKFRITL